MTTKISDDFIGGHLFGETCLDEHIANCLLRVVTGGASRQNPVLASP